MSTDILLLDTDVEASLRATVRDALRDHCPAAGVRAAYDGDRSLTPRLWQLIARDLGLAGLLVPETQGGAGATAREAAVVMEELGRHVAPVPFLESSVIAATVLAAGNSPLLGRLASGDVTVALVAPLSATVVEPTLMISNGGIRGRVSTVAGALDADVLLAPVPVPGGMEIHAVHTADARVEPVSSLDMSRPVADVAFDGAPGERVLAAVDGRRVVERALLLGAAMLAAESVGLARWSLEATVDYVRERRQFGRAVGGFQAVKHRLADLFVDVESATAAARYAAGVWSLDHADVPVATAVAASYCSDLGVRAAEEALQLHGGIGMTWEHPTHLYLKRAKANQIALGTADLHRSRLGSLMEIVLERERPAGC